MKLKTSFFDKTILRKNITRFAPLWGIYQLCLLVGLGLDGAAVQHLDNVSTVP